MKSFIIADYTNFGQYGGIEKNAEYITLDLEKKLNLKIHRVLKRRDLIIILIKSIIRFKFVDYFICYKNSSLTGMIFKIFGTKLIIRFNNSPESYLFWFKLNSLLSHLLKIILTKSEIIICNSQKIKSYYNLFSRNNSKIFYLPNKFIEKNLIINKAKINKIFLASRLSKEKNLLNSFQTLNSISQKIGYKVLAYTSTKNDIEDLLEFNKISYFFNDIYVSLSFYEGMPNMAYEALFKGSALLLSNCWSHIEIHNLLIKYNLENRIFISNIHNKENLIYEINKLKEKIQYDEIEIVKYKLSKLKKDLEKEYENNLQKIISHIRNSS